MYVSEFIAAREREAALASPDPDIPQAEWEALWTETLRWSFQQASIAGRGLVFAIGDSLPFTRAAVRQHAAKWINHPEWREEWKP